VTIAIPRPSLVVLIGPSGAGKSTFARKHFKRTETVSSDFCRALVSDDESDQSATESAFEVVRLIAAKRLSAGRLTVIDATSVQPHARVPLVALAHEHNVPAIAIVLDLPEELCIARSQARPGRPAPAEVVQSQVRDLTGSLPGLLSEGFQLVYLLSAPGEVDDAFVVISSAM
jgi:protein phosphatase